MANPGEPLVELHHFYHCYAAGDWAQAVTEHCDALTRFGLYDRLASLHVGFVGTDEQVAAVRCTLDVLTPDYRVCAQTEAGWEQVTLTALHEFVQDHDGLVSYAHTKGASRVDPVDGPWRRSMEYYNFVDWRRPAAALAFDNALVAGCHWTHGTLIEWYGDSGDSQLVAGQGTSGWFGGNYWWARCEVLRRNVPPEPDTRHHAEHWIGLISGMVPFEHGSVFDLNPGPVGNFKVDW